MNILGQIIGFVAVGFSVLIFTRKKRSGTLKFKLISDLLWITHFLLIGAYSGMATTAIAVFREILFFKQDRYPLLRKPFLIPLFSICYYISAAFTWNNIFSILPPTASTVSTIGLWQTNIIKIRVMGLFASILMFTYGIANGSVATMVNEVLTTTSIVLTFIIKNNTKAIKENNNL